MAKTYNPKRIIKNLEKFSIYPYQHLMPILPVIIRKDARQDKASYLKSLQRKAKEYGTMIVVEYASNIHDAAELAGGKK